MPSIFRTLAVAALAAAVFAGSTAAQQTERCYGVARAGQNDGLGTEAEPGSATRDYQGDAWTETPVGTCLTLPLPDAPDGTPRRGSFEPLTRDLP